MEMLKKRKKSGFTLIEMIVVIAIVVIIAAIAIPQALKAVNKSKASTDIANARTYAGQIASRLANGDLTTGTSDDTNKVNTGAGPFDIKEYHIGDSTATTDVSKSKLTDKNFKYKYTTNEIEIYIDSEKVYPTVPAASTEYAKYIK